MSGVKAIGIEIPDLNGDNIVDDIVNSILDETRYNYNFNDKIKSEHLGIGLPIYDIQDKDIIGIQTSIEINKEDCQKIVELIKKQTGRNIYVFSNNFANGLFNYMDARKIVEGIGNEVVIIKNFN